MFKDKEDDEEEVDDKLFADNIKYDEENYNKLIKQYNKNDRYSTCNWSLIILNNHFQSTSESSTGKHFALNKSSLSKWFKSGEFKGCWRTEEI